MRSKLTLVRWGLAVLLILPLAGCTKSSRAARMLRQANEHFSAGEFEKAEIEYLNVLRVDRTNHTAIRNLGLLSFEQDDFQRAWQCMQITLQQDSNDLLARLRISQMLLTLDEGNPNPTNRFQARTNALTILAQQPTNEMALYVLVDTYRRSELAQAEAALEKFRPTLGASSGLQVALGILQMRGTNQATIESRLVTAEGHFRKAVAISTNNYQAFGLLGDALLARAAILNSQKQADKASAVMQEAESYLRQAAKLAPMRSVQRIRFATFKLASARSTNDVAEARATLQEIVTKAPDYSPALVKLAAIGLQEKEFSESARYLQKVLAKTPYHYEAQMLMVQLQLAQKQPALALGTLEKLSKSHPSSAQVYLLMAQIQSAQGDLDKASVSASRAVSLTTSTGQEPLYIEASLLLADLKRRKDETRTSVEILKGLLTKRPDLAQARFMLLDAYADEGQVGNALRECQELLRTYPTNALVWFAQGSLYGLQTNLVESSRSYEQALKWQPRYYQAAERLNVIDVQQKNVAAALARCEKLVAENPKAPEPLQLQAAVFFGQRDFDKAEGVLNKALELAPDYSPAYTLLADIYVLNGKFGEAEKKLKESIASRTNNISAMIHLAGLYSRATNYTAAKDTLEAVLKISPQHLAAMNDLAYVYSEHLGDQDRALKLATQAYEGLSGVSRRSENERLIYGVADTLGWVHFRRGDYPAALGLLKESASKLSNNPEVAYHLGKVYYMLGEEQLAKTTLLRALELQGKLSFAWSEDARERLEILRFDAASANADAKKRLEQEKAKSPADTVVGLKLAMLLEREGAWDQAVALYEKAAQANPRLLQPVLRLAQIQAGPLKSPAKALVHARAAYKLAQDNAPVVGAIGRVAYLAGDYEWAETLLEDASRKLPADPGVALDLASAAATLGLVPQAGSALAKALAGGPSFARLAEARSLEQMLGVITQPTAPPAAAAAARDYLAKNPESIPAQLAVAAVTEQAGEYAKAADLYEKILSKVPACQLAHRQAALLWAGRLNNPGKAYNSAVKAREAYPDDVRVARTLGILVCQKAEYGRAAQLLAEASRKLDKDPELLYYLGLAQFNLKQRDQSRQSLRSAVALNLPDAMATDAKRMLSELK